MSHLQDRFFIMFKYIGIAVVALVIGFYVTFTEYRIKMMTDSLSIQAEINNNLINALTEEKALTQRQSEVIIMLHDRTTRIERYLSSSSN